VARRSAGAGSSSSQQPPAQLHWLEKLLYQSASAAVAGGVTTPLDVVKTRLMTQSGGARRYRGWWDCLRATVAEEGAGALLSGLRPRVLWLGIGGAVFMGSFEALSELPALRGATAAP
jgi:solute carrier family 25 S-adenosylmethionine transporter 26